MGQVVLLGTGGALNPERAQTSLAFPLQDGHTMLLDASSGTVLLRQLEAAGIPLVEVRHVFFSHIHFDHVGGLVPLLAATAALPEARLTAHATRRTSEGLRTLLRLVLPGVEDWIGGRLLWRELVPGSPVRLAGTEVTPFAVDHSVEGLGFRVRQGASVAVFSGDTRPCPSLVDYARGADLLIHEAHGPDREAGLAHSLGHSTAGDAGRTARDAGAGRLVLTHLGAGPRAEPAALVPEAAEVFGGGVSAAQDLEAFRF